MLEYAAAHVNTRVGETLETTPRDLRVGVLHGRNHASNARVEQAIGTRRRVAVVAARL